MRELFETASVCFRVSFGFQATLRHLAQLQLSLQDFDHASFHRMHAWDIQYFAQNIASFLPSVLEEDIRSVIEKTLTYFNHTLLPDAPLFRRSVIMGDCNDANIILLQSENESAKVIGLIDFGDAVLTWSMNDLATAMCYSLLTPFGREHPMDTLKALFLSYQSISPLLRVEIKHLKVVIMLRLSLSIAIGAYSIAHSPMDDYLKLHAIPAKKAILFIDALEDTFFIGLLPADNGNSGV